ncbi:MAG: glycosyltransferase family 2 protein [Coriobacteriales bacterium]|jgi:glycosyltransferase involved in cell wall biosynthesis|nr:glycosyltransferase family 2 protein [Coriobacteriales bacterium]
MTAASAMSATPYANALEPIRLVSLVVIAYNEEQTIEGLLGDIVAQDHPHDRIELLFVDSASTDGTKGLLEEFAHKESSFANIRVLDNPARFLPQGCNVALRAYSGDVFIRVDAHAQIPADFIRRNVEVLESGESVCGGVRPTVLQKPTSWGEALLLAENSAFGSSPAAYRRGQERSIVGSVFHGAYRREVFDVVGPYDERLLRTEDNDMSYRIHKAGFRIVLDPAIRSEQFVRSSFCRMARQKEANGYWIGRMVYIQPGAISLFHLVPLAFVLALLAFFLMGLLLSWLPFIALVALYLLADLAMALRAIIQASERSVALLVLPFIFPLIHISYGIGTIRGLLVGLFREKGAPYGQR